MKPNWNKAPKWASWLAMDKDGTWWWFEQKPVLCGTTWAVARGKEQRPNLLSAYKTSRESRPA